MAGELEKEFVSRLRKMSDAEVRLQIDPSVQPTPILRSTAVIEIEKRRQKQAKFHLKREFSITKVAAWVVWIALGIIILFIASIILTMVFFL